MFLYQEKFNKSYDNYLKSKEDAIKTFVKNLENIEAHNKRINESYKRSLQMHSDLTLSEKKTYRMGVKKVKSSLIQNTTFLNTSAPHIAPYGNI